MQRSGQAADREDITRQAGSRRQAANGQSRIGSPGKHKETEYRGNAQNVSRGKTRLRNVFREVCCLYVDE